MRLLFHEYEVDGGYKTAEGREVIPVQDFILEAQNGKDGKHDKCNNFLHHF